METDAAFLPAQIRQKNVPTIYLLEIASRKSSRNFLTEIVRTSPPDYSDKICQEFFSWARLCTPESSVRNSLKNELCLFSIKREFLSFSKRTNDGIICKKILLSAYFNFPVI
jgi:hypothetical protein